MCSFMEMDGAAITSALYHSGSWHIMHILSNLQYIMKEMQELVFSERESVQILIDPTPTCLATA